MMLVQGYRVYEFNNFLMDVGERSLLRDGEPVQLTPKAFDTLLALVSRGGHLVEKDELLKEVWPDTFVEEATLAQNISTLRKVLGQERNGQQYIETVPKRGYRFVSSVRLVQNEAGADLIVQRQTRAHIIIEEEENGSDETRAVSHETQPTLNNVEDALRIASRPVRRVHAKVVWTSALLLLLACAGSLYLWTARSRSSDAGSQIKSIAVLPFRPLGTDSGDELLGLGMADATITKLSNFPSLSVLPTSTVFSYTGHERNALAAGRELGVEAVLNGTLQRAGERVRVTVQLIRLSDGKILWSDKFDEHYTGIFDIQDSISEQVAHALALQITGEKVKQFAKRYTTSTEAYQAYLMGIYFWNKRSQEGLGKAIEYFQGAIATDPNYALAYASLADTYFLEVYYHYGLLPKREALEKGRAAAATALQLDDTLAEAHVAMAMFQTAQEMNLEASMKSLRRALELNPNYALAHQRYAWLLIGGKDLDEAVRHMKRAQELDPLSPTNNSAFGVMLIYARQYDEALRYCRRAVELDPESAGLRINLGAVYEQKGLYAEALGEYQKAKELNGNNESDRLAASGHALALAGHKSEAQKVLAELEERAKREDVSSYNVALLHAALGQKSAAFDWLDKAAAAHALELRDLRYDPQLDTIREDPRFNDFLRRHSYDEPTISWSS